MDSPFEELDARDNYYRPIVCPPPEFVPHISTDCLILILQCLTAHEVSAVCRKVNKQWHGASMLGNSFRYVHWWSSDIEANLIEQRRPVEEWKSILMRRCLPPPSKAVRILHTQWQYLQSDSQQPARFSLLSLTNLGVDLTHVEQLTIYTERSKVQIFLTTPTSLRATLPRLEMVEVYMDVFDDGSAESLDVPFGLKVLEGIACVRFIASDYMSWQGAFGNAVLDSLSHPTATTTRAHLQELSFSCSTTHPMRRWEKEMQQLWFANPRLLNLVQQCSSLQRLCVQVHWLKDFAASKFPEEALVTLLCALPAKCTSVRLSYGGLGSRHRVVRFRFDTFSQPIRPPYVDVDISHANCSNQNHMPWVEKAAALLGCSMSVTWEERVKPRPLMYIMPAMNEEANASTSDRETYSDDEWG